MKIPTIDRFQDGTLLAIFDFAVAPVFPFRPGTREFRQAISLTHVSHRWRKILLDCGRIWSDIHISGQDVDILSTLIKRCKGAPLSVSINIPRAFAKRSRRQKFWSDLGGAANLIQEHRNQVTRLEHRLGRHSFRRLLGFEWPNLEEFDWIDDGPLDSSIHQVDYDGELPRLRNLSISLNGGFNWPMTVAKHLTTLSLKGRGPMDLELAVFTEFLRKNTSLESLTLTNLKIRGSPSREKPIGLPHLNELSVHRTTCGDVLDLLDLPSLKRLQASFPTGQSFWSDSHLSKFYGRLSITSLNAKYFTHRRGNEIRVVGSNGSDTESLYLKELSRTKMDTALSRSMSSPWLSSITSFSFIEKMPEEVISFSQISAICGLLRHLSRVECMHLCPSELAIEVVRRLWGDPELCPRLKELGIMVTDKTRKTALDLAGEMLKARAGGGDGWEMMEIDCPYQTGFQRAFRLRTEVVLRKANSRSARGRWVRLGQEFTFAP